MLTWNELRILGRVSGDHAQANLNAGSCAFGGSIGHFPRVSFTSKPTLESCTLPLALGAGPGAPPILVITVMRDAGFLASRKGLVLIGEESSHMRVFSPPCTTPYQRHPPQPHPMLAHISIHDSSQTSPPQDLSTNQVLLNTISPPQPSLITGLCHLSPLLTGTPLPTGQKALPHLQLALPLNITLAVTASTLCTWPLSLPPPLLL